MKPLNLDNRPCSPISSNCVVWQGPTLDCIELCNGDTISDVVAKMAEELCTLLDQTNVDNYDLTCLGITACGPKDFQALIQLLIEKICELYNLPIDGTKSEGACPDCPVTVASCLRETDANLPVTMQLVDYVQMLASKICSLIDAIGDLQDQINSLNIRVTILEEATPPSFTLPNLTVICDLGASVNISPGTTVNPSVSRTIDIVLDALINDSTNGYCIYTATLGPVSQLLTAISRKCILDGTDRLSGSGTYGSLSGWVPDASYDTVADAINNIWLVLCDVFNYVESISINVEDTNSIDLTVTSGVISANIVDTGWEPLNGFDFMPLASRPQCRRIGNQVHFRGVVVVPLPDPVSPGVVKAYTSTAYNSVALATTFSGGPSGCYINSNGSIVFNQDASVIPNAIVGTLINLDNTYGMGWIIGNRQIDLGDGYGTALSAALSVGITSDKKLYAAVLKDLEYTSTVQNPAQLGSSHLRYITSNVTAGEKVPNFLNANTAIHSSPNSGSVTTTTVPLPPPLAPDTQYQTLNNLNVEYNTFTYPFNCNAGDENQIGGFAFRIDGLIAYLDPCTTDIKSYICGEV